MTTYAKTAFYISRMRFYGDAEHFLEIFGEILLGVESDHVGNFADRQTRVAFQKLGGPFQPHGADELGRGHAGYGLKLPVAAYRA